MSFFEHKLNLKVKLNAVSDNQSGQFDFQLENHTPDYYLSASDVNVSADTFEVGTDIFENNQKVRFNTDGTLPSPLNNYQNFYIKTFTSGTPNTITFSTTQGGAKLNLTTSGSGTHIMKGVISTGDYRILSYHNIRWDKSSMGTQVAGGNGTSGDTDGYLSLSTPNEFSFNTPEYPPKILPQDGSYTYRSKTRMGSAEFRGNGSIFSGMYIRLRHASGWQFITNPSTGQLEYEVANSYSSTSASSYEENSSFILERNVIDPNLPDSDNWTAVQEWSNSDVMNPETGVYPYGPLIKDQTSIDHYAVHATQDATIRLQSPNSNYGSNTTVEMFNSVNDDIRRAMFHYDVSAIEANTVSKAETWVFCTNSNATFDDIIELVSLSADFNESTVTWNNGAGLFNEIIDTKDVSVVPGDVWRDGYIPLEVPVSAVQDWVDNPANNHGIGIKYQDEGSFTEVSPTFASTENSTYYKRPLIVVSYYGTSGGINVNANQTNQAKISSDILQPIISYGITQDIGLVNSVSADMLPLAYVGDPNIEISTHVVSVSANMLTANVGGTSGLPFDVNTIFLESQMLIPNVSAVFNQSADMPLVSVSADMLQPYIFVEVILPTIEFGVPIPTNKTAILPTGDITVEVTAWNHNPLSYTSIGLTSNSISSAAITSAWQVDPLTTKAIIYISANDNISGILEVSAINDLGTSAVSADTDYSFVIPTSAVSPVIVISNDPANKIIDPEPVIVTVQVISPGYTDIQSFGLLDGSVGTIISAGIVNPFIPYPNLTYIIEISGSGELLVSVDDIYENVVSASDGIYVNYNNSKLSCSGRELDLVNFLPGHLKNGEVGEFIKFFEEFLNNMYYCQNDFRNDPEKQTNEYKISILEKIFRLSTLHDPDIIDMDYIQFFANYLGYDINISRGDLGNLTNSDLTSINTNGNDPDNDVSDSIVSQRYLRFAVRNLPTWYRIKTTRNVIKVMLFSFGLVGDILINFTAPIEEGGYNNDESKWLTYDDRYTDSTLLSQVPSDWFNTPHFSISIDYDNSPVNWFKQLPMIIDAIESVRPINTVLDEISATIKRRVYPIHINAASRVNSTKYFKGATIPNPVEPEQVSYIEDESGNILVDDNGNQVTYE